MAHLVSRMHLCKVGLLHHLLIGLSNAASVQTLRQVADTHPGAGSQLQFSVSYTNLAYLSAEDVCGELTLK